MSLARPACGSKARLDTDLDFMFPRGLAVFRTGGELVYHHDGISLQEMVVPVLSLRIPSAKIAAEAGASVALEGHPGVVINRTTSPGAGVDGGPGERNA